MKFLPHFIAVVSFLGILYLIELSKEQTQNRNEEIAEKHILATKANNSIDSINIASKIELETMDLIIQLTDDYEKHQKIGSKLSDKKINELEAKIELDLPTSYKLFLKYFGDGARKVYGNSINKVTQANWLPEIRKNIQEKIEINNEKVNTNSLWCLISKDSNGGAWCWLTSEGNENGEWPLVYYSAQDKKLHHKISNFTEWLKIIVKNKSEIISSLNNIHHK